MKPIVSPLFKFNFFSFHFNSFHFSMANNIFFFFIKADLRNCFANVIRHTEVLKKSEIFLTENTTIMFV